MPFSDIFNPKCDPIEPHDAPNHVVFSCLQWKTPSLEVMPRLEGAGVLISTGLIH